MGLSGQIGAGFGAGLEELIARQLLEAQFEEQKRARAAQEAQQSAGLAQRATEHQDLMGARAADDDRADRAMQAQASRAQYESDARANMSELVGDPTQLAAFSMASGVDLPKGVQDIVTPKEPKRVSLTRVTTRGPDGKPLIRGVTDEELAQGVPGYEAPKAPSGGGSERPMTTGQRFTAQMQLRRMFNTETAAAKIIDSQVRLMREGLKAAEAGNMAAGSQAVLVTFQKILDPTSVVRESEYARSASGQAMLSRIEGAYEQLARGGAGVPLAELKKFVQLAESFAVESARSAAESRQQIDAIARDFGIDPSNITRDFGAADQPDVAPQGGPSDGPTATPSIGRYQDYLKRKGGGM